MSLTIAEAAGIRVIREGFADRAYTQEGRLVARTEPGAVLDDPAEVAAQAVGLLGEVASVCVHSDSPGALELARSVRAALESAGAELRARHVVKLRPYGDTALLVDCESLEEAQGWYAALSDHAPAVLGARTVLLRGVPSDLRALVGSTSPSRAGHGVCDPIGRDPGDV